MRLCDTDIERYLDDGIIALTPQPSNDKINGATIDVRLGILSAFSVSIPHLILISVVQKNKSQPNWNR